MNPTLASLLICSVFTWLLFFGWGGDFLPRGYLQFYKNLDQNDNRLNYANHEYAYNALMSTELNSIFMTEGGDNQVFSLLYFATAEKKRPDIDFFDQKGNVFPRLYGDLLKTYPEELRLIREIRDYQLFSTGRPVYLTWKRSNLERLSLTQMQSLKAEVIKKSPSHRRQLIDRRFRLDSLEELKYTARHMIDESIFDLNLRSGSRLDDQDFKYLGPWYYKQFGMLFRVTPIRYAIVDGLEFNFGRGNYDSLTRYVELKTKVKLTENQFNFYLRQLSEEGYVTLGKEVVLKKPFLVLGEVPSIRYWDHYLFSHTNVYNSGQWDFLTREIFGSYIRIRSNHEQEEEKFYHNRAKLASNPDLKTQSLNEARLHQARSLALLAQSTRYNYDNPYMIFNYGQRLYFSGKQEESTKYFARSSSYDYKLGLGYLQAVIILGEILKKTQDLDQKNRLETQINKYLNDFYAAKRIRYSSLGKIQDLEKDQEVLQARKLESELEYTQAVSKPRVDELEALASNSIEKTYQLIQVLKQRGDDKKVIRSYQQLVGLDPRNFKHYLEWYQYTSQKGMIVDSIKILEDIIKNYSDLEGQKPPIWSISYDLAYFYFSSGSQLLKNLKRVRGRRELIKSKELFEAFARDATKFATNDEIKKRIEVSKKLIQQIEQILTQYP